MFRAGVEKQLEKEAPGWQAFGLDNLISDVYLIARLKDSRIRKTVRFSGMEAIFEAEKIRARRFSEEK